MKKLVKVFNSCKTEQQFDTALRYTNLFIKTLPEGKYVIASNIMIIRFIERIIGYTQGRLNISLQE